METLAAIAGRRSIRKYKSDPVDDATLAKILEAVRQAPTWANTQCWRLVVVRDKEIKNRLADTMFAFPNRPNVTAEGVRTAPIAVAFCAELNRSGYSFAEPKKPSTDKGEYWFMFDTALAMENFCLSAHSLGLGTVIIGAFNPKAAAEVLKLPPGYAVVALSPLGYPDEAPAARPRKELAETVFKNEFGAK
jgi:nitroreductase